MEDPRERARAHVVRMDIGGRGSIGHAARGQRHDDQVFEDPAGIVGLQRAHRADVAVQADAQIHAAVVAERRDRLTRACIDRREVSRIDVEKPPIRAVLARPVVHAARADEALVLMHPDLASRRRVERDDRSVFREHVHDALDDDRVEQVALAGRIGPRHLQTGHVALVDLSER